MPPRNCQTLELSTRSAEETRAFGRQLASGVRRGDLICLRGDLGAGKTTLIKGLAEGLGVTDLVTSPSFTLIHQHSGSAPFYHIDLYRLSAADVTDIGLEEIIGGDGVVAVEWAENLPGDLAREALDIEIAFDEADERVRRIHLRARGPRAARILSCLAEETDVRPRA